MCFVLFGCIWDCLVALLGAKRAARQNFSQQTQPIRPHWTLSSCFSAFRIIWVHWGPFGCVTTLSLKRVKLVQKFVTRSRVRIFRNERTRSTPLDKISYFYVFHTILVQLGLFGWLAKLDGKCAELVRKFVPRSRIGTFRNELTRSTPLDPKLMFWSVLYYFIAFGTVWLRYETRCKIGRTSAKVRATMSRQNFSQRTHPVHPIGP